MSSPMPEPDHADAAHTADAAQTADAAHAAKAAEAAGAAFPTALRAAIAASGRSLESLRRRLQDRGTPVSIATLSYWQSGRSVPQRATSIEAVGHLEDILELAPGLLVSTLGPARRPGPPRAVRPAADLPMDAPVARRALEGLGFTRYLELVNVTVHDTLEVDEHGIERLRTVRHVLRATRDGAQRMAALLTVEEPGGDTAEFSAVSGGRLGRVVSEPDQGVFVAELLLDRPLRAGETAAVEHQVRLPRDLSRRHSVEYYLVHRVTEIMLWVRFHPAKLPRIIEGYTVVDGEASSLPLTLDGATSVQHVAHRIGPGTVGVRWAW